MWLANAHFSNKRVQARGFLELPSNIQGTPVAVCAPQDEWTLNAAQAWIWVDRGDKERATANGAVETVPATSSLLISTHKIARVQF